jgi:hypothetical protein
VAISVVGCGGDDRTEAVPWTRMSTPPGAETPTVLELRVEAVFGGSSCSELDGWTVDETDAEVVVTATATFEDGDCTSDQVREPYVVVLEEPLGTRRLVGCEPDQDSADCMLFDRIP